VVIVVGFGWWGVVTMVGVVVGAVGVVITTMLLVGGSKVFIVRIVIENMWSVMWDVVVDVKR